MALKNVAVDENKVEVGTENVPVVLPEVAPVTEIKVEKKEETPVVTEIKKEVIVDKKPDFDPNAFVKENFGYDSVEVAKQEFEKLKKPKEGEPLKFKNADSEKVFNAVLNGELEPLRVHLQKQKELSETEKISAADAIKLQLKYKNIDFSQDDVNDEFEERYSLPAKPEQNDDETDAAFKNREKEYENQVKKIEKRIERDGKVAKAELSKLNTELVFPDIKNSNVNEVALKEQQDKIRKDYEQALESDFTKFNGFSVTYKDKDVEIPISYSIPEEEKVATKNDLKEMDVDDFLGNRWFGKDGKPNIQRQMSDKYILNNFDRIIQKIAQDAGGRVYDHYVNNQKHITIGEPSHNISGTVDNRTDLQKAQDARWKKTG